MSFLHFHEPLFGLRTHFHASVALLITGSASSLSASSPSFFSRKASQKDWACENISYDSDVSLTLLVSEEDVVEAERFLADESCGKVVPEDGGGIMIAGNPVSLV